MFQLPEHFSMMMVAPRRTGKTFLLCRMLQYGLTERFDYIGIFCPTANKNRAFDEFKPDMTEYQEKTFLKRRELDREGNPTSIPVPLLPESERKKFHIHYEIDEELIQRLLKEQDEAVVAVAEREAIGDFSLRVPRLLIVFDDCLASHFVSQYGHINNLAYNGRHMHTAFICLSQHFNKIGKGARMNSDVILILRPFSIAELETFVEQFCVRCNRKFVIDSVLDIFKIPHQFLFLDNTEPDIRRRFKISIAQDYTDPDIEPEILELPYGREKRKAVDDYDDDHDSLFL
jgi:hypothetical protein